MRYLKTSFISFVLILLFLIPCFSVTAAAAKEETEAGHRIVVDDQADLLTEEEEKALIEDMRPAAGYGEIGFLSVDQNSQSAAALAESYYLSTFGKVDGSLFLIDMDNRKIYIYSGGRNYNVITKGKADTITDNVYRFASKKEYYACASETYREIATLLEGGRISEPMRYVVNGFLALILALLINFIIVNAVTRVRKVRKEELISVANWSVDIGKPTARYTGETRRYDPVETSGGGSSGGGGGGGGGGGFSGGGGGHSF